MKTFLWNLLVFTILTTFLTPLNALQVVQTPQRDRRKLSISNKICETVACIDTASIILNNMNKSADPCDDFYEFTCGNFVKQSAIPDGESSINQFSFLEDKVQQQLRISVENPITNSDLRSFKLLQTFYKTCSNTTQIDKNSEQDLKDILKKFGGWPVLENQSWNESSFDWKNITYTFPKFGFSFNYFIGFGIFIDLQNSSKYSIFIDQPALGLDQEYMVKGLNESTVQAYYKYMVDYVVLLGANREQALKELLESLNFEIELAKISLSNEKRGNASEIFSKMTIQELQRSYPGIPWLEYFNNLLGPNLQVDAKEEIIRGPDLFIKNIPGLIARTPKRVLANYAFWSVAYDAADLMSSRIKQLQTEFESSYTGVSVERVRWKSCMTAVSNNMGPALASLYVREHFDQSSKIAVEEQLEDIRNSFKNILNQTTWMDEKTRSLALKKLHRIIPIVAYPDELLSDQILEDFYKNLTMDANSYLNSQLGLNKFNLAYNLARLRKPVNKTDWTTHSISHIVNAYYSDAENSINFPAAILQNPLFSKDRPKYLNYGSIGWFMGHEMTHGFNNNGRLYDEFGNLFNWWGATTEKQFLQRAQCIVDQYGNYTVSQVGLNINGVLTEGENIADNGGVKEAYLAYVDWEKKNGKEPRLPGLPYTSRQMFWISSASSWCNQQLTVDLRNQMLTDGHSPSKYRVIGTLSNRPEFAKDFNCPANSRMNPAKKCRVW